MFRRLDETIAVAPQITVDQVGEAAAAGFAAIINNRPDDEQPGQPAGADIAVAAEAAGLRYTAIPVDHSGFYPDQVTAMRDALAGSHGPVLAFCRSGTRSTWLWALARAQAGEDTDTLIEKAAAQGYDLSALPRMIAG